MLEHQPETTSPLGRAGGLGAVYLTATPVVTSPPTSLEAAILETVLYSDLFSYPLTISEIQRFLIGQNSNLAEVEQALVESPYLQATLEQDKPYVFLRGRGEIVARRLEREKTSLENWRQAKPYLKWLQAVPFLRSTMVTGALALDNAPADDDIDLLLITAPNRLWLCRAVVIMIVRLARLRRVTLCPNYLLTTEALELDDHDLYTAHEMFQMRFISGKPGYQTLLEKNTWAAGFLPNAFPQDFTVIPENVTPWLVRLQSAGEWLFGGRVGQVFENWEQGRKVRRFRAKGGLETNFSDRVCKGHYGGYAGRTLKALAERKAEFPWLSEVEADKRGI